MNYLFITTYYWINIEAFKSILNQINIESNCDLKNWNRIVRFLTIPSPNANQLALDSNQCFSSYCASRGDWSVSFKRQKTFLHVASRGTRKRLWEQPGRGLSWNVFAVRSYIPFEGISSTRCGSLSWRGKVNVLLCLSHSLQYCLFTCLLLLKGQEFDQGSSSRSCFPTFLICRWGQMNLMCTSSLNRKYRAVFSWKLKWFLSASFC